MPESGLEILIRWAGENWPGGDPGSLRCEPIPADGSPRLFARLQASGLSLVGLYNPENPPENRAWQHLAGHLVGLGLPVARLLAADSGAGLFLMEDLGETSLQELVLTAKNEDSQARLYRPVLAMLAAMQARADRGFDLGVCFDGERLSPEFLLRREAGYFMEQFVAGALAMKEDELPSGLYNDLQDICRRAGEAGPQGFVHRDFQSRNIVMGPSGPGMVDFQGARLGPAQYDLASLLHDPYVDLDWGLRKRLLDDYLLLRMKEGSFDEESFRKGWPFVSLSRVMQALGAYAFLTRVRGRVHFAAHVRPALATLRRLAGSDELKGHGAFIALVDSFPLEPPLERFAPQGDAVK